MEKYTYLEVKQFPNFFKWLKMFKSLFFNCFDMTVVIHLCLYIYISKKYLVVLDYSFLNKFFK